MSTWVVISWISVGILTAVNIFVFLKLKQASEQMMKMMFPGAKNMNEALSQMQKMMGSLQRGGGRPGFPGGFQRGQRGGKQDPQLRAAMEMLQNMQKKK